MRNMFWLWLARFAVRRIKPNSYGGLPDGIPGRRSDDSRCPAYIPGPVANGADCDGDGHYLCYECINLNRDSSHD